MAIYRRRKIDYQILVAYLIVTIGILVGLWIINAFIHLRLAQSWPQTTALIYESYPAQITTSPFDKNEGLYQLDVSYKYRVENRSYFGTKVFMTNIPLFSEPQVKSLQAHYDIGSIHDVFYDPDNPASAILVKSSSPALIFLLALTLLFLIIGFLLIRTSRRIS